MCNKYVRWWEVLRRHVKQGKGRVMGGECWFGEGTLKRGIRAETWKREGASRMSGEEASLQEMQQVPKLSRQEQALSVQGAVRRYSGWVEWGEGAWWGWWAQSSRESAPTMCGLVSHRYNLAFALRGEAITACWAVNCRIRVVFLRIDYSGCSLERNWGWGGG